MEEPKVGQVWQTLTDEGTPGPLLLLVSETRRTDGRPWYWTVVDVATGRTSTVQLHDHGRGWKWMRHT